MYIIRQVKPSDNHFKGIQKNRKVLQLDDYIKAGKIAAEVREMTRERNWVGKTVYEICEEVENQIKKRGAKCAFPVNVSINEIAAHYTAEPNDPITIKIGKTVYEICEEVENQIKKRGAKCAFPVNVSINEIAAHYTAEPNDPITIT